MEPTHVFEQHPVPQHISSYQFRLVGDMTIKQFLELAGGAGIALLFYASPLPGFLKWPFIIFFALAGAALAFLPIQDRPLEQWVTAFLRSTYSPTILNWTKAATPVKYFADSTEPQAPSLPAGQPQSPIDTLTESVTKSGNTFLKNLEEAEHAVLGKITGLFNQNQSTPTPIAPPVIQNPTPPTESPPIIKPLKQEIITPREERVATDTKGFQSPVAPTPTTTTPGTPQTISETLPTQPVAEAPTPKPAAPSPQNGPLPPSQPNIIVGQVVDQKGQIIEAAILEIKDPLNRPVRAFRTNKTGHFMIVTPLANGRYQIITEKEGHTFDQVQIEAKGALIPPITIKAK